MAQSAYESVMASLAQVGANPDPAAAALALQYEVLWGLRDVNARRIAQLETVAVRDRDVRAANDRERRVRAYVIAPFIATEID